MRGIDEVAIIGVEAEALLAVINNGYRPNMILAYADQDQGDSATPLLLAHRSRVGGKAAAYVCRKFVCQQPVTTAEKLSQVLNVKL